jgi:hypothetical protein
MNYQQEFKNDCQLGYRQQASCPKIEDVNMMYTLREQKPERWPSG